MAESRLLTPDDAAVYCELRRAMLIESPWSFLGAPGDDRPSDEGFFRQEIAKDGHEIASIWTASRLDAVAGVRREPHAKRRHHAVIVGVYCRPEARGQGYGRSVVRLAINTAFSWEGVDRVWLSVGDGSHEAIELYESMGFQRWGYEPDAVRIGGESRGEIYLSMARA